MKLCPGQCRYLLAVHELSRKNKPVRSIDVANYLSVTRASVSHMLKCMSSLELIESDYSTGILLTDFGEKTAAELYSKYAVINCFFSNILKLSEPEASKQSMEFLVSFPDDTIARLSKITKNTMNRRHSHKEK